MKRVAIILLSIFLALGLQAQQQLPIITGGNGNFFEDKAAFWNQLQSEATGKNTQPESLYTYKEYSRWLKFWDKRIPASGLYNDYYAALDSFYAADKAANKPSADDAKFELPNWCELGPKNLPFVGRVYKIRLHPQYGVSEIGPDGSQKKPNEIMFCCSPGGGLWKKDGENPWIPLNNGLKQTSAADVVISFQNDQIMYLATGAEGIFPWTIFRSAGVYKSTNGGQSWQTTGLDYSLTQGKHLSRIWIDPTDDNTVVAFARHGGTYRTIDGGLNWTQVQDIGDYITDTWANENNPVNKQIIYAVGAEGLYRSTDAGATWTLLTNNTVIDSSTLKHPGNGQYYCRINMTVEDFDDADPSNDFIFLGVGAPFLHLYGQEKIHYSYDGGANWVSFVPVTSGGVSSGVPGHDHGALEILYPGADFVNGNFNLMVGGKDYYQIWNLNYEFTNFQPNPKYSVIKDYTYYTDVNDLVYTNDKSTLFVASDGGVYKGIYNNATGEFNYSGFLEGLGVAHVWDFDDSELDEELIITGTQDCSGFFTKNNGNNWSGFGGGDHYTCEVDKFDENQWYYSINYNKKLYRDGPNNRTYNLFGYLGGSGGEFITGAIEQDYSNKNILYVPTASTGVWELGIIDPDNSYSSVPANTNNQQNLGRISSIAIAKSNNNHVYFSYTSGINENGNSYKTKQLFKTTKGANSQAGDWVDITPTPLNIVGCTGSGMDRRITSIVVDSENENRIWVGYATSISWAPCSILSSVLYSENGGQTWESWSNGLPSLGINKLAHEPKSNDRLYAATDVGVYVFDKALMRWFKYGDSFKAKVMDLEYNEKKEVLRVATYGRGVWETNAYCPSVIGWDFVNNPTLPDFYEAKQYINSSVSLASSTEKTTFKAGDHISLKAGFHASGSSANFKFHAFVKPFPCHYVCDPSSFNFSKPENEFKEEKEQVFKEQSEYLKLYPNPFDSKITLELWMNATEKADLYLTDVYGKQYAVPMQNTQLQKGKNVLNIDFPNLAKGIYFLQLKTEKQTYVRQIVKL